MNACTAFAARPASSPLTPLMTVVAAGARAAAAIEHQNIVGVHDVGQERGLYYIVMQFIEGDSLEEKIDQETTISPKECVRLTIEAARGLGAGRWRSFRTVVLPQLYGPIYAGSLLVALYALSDFGAEK